MPLSMAIEDNRICFEIQGEKHCLLFIKSELVKPIKAAALVPSIVCERGQNTVVRLSIKRRIKGKTVAIYKDIVHFIFHVQTGHCYFVQDYHIVPH